MGIHCGYKAFTATIIALLVEDGKISYDDNPLELLGADLSEAHEYWKDLTLAHCLQHTSGFGFTFEELLPMDDTNLVGFGEPKAEGSSQCFQPTEKIFQVRSALDPSTA